MSDARPTVSVVVPAYNAEGLVGDAIRSALAQTAPLTEVVAVDDGSTDGTLAVLRAIEAEQPGRLTVLTGPNQGGSAARNRGLKVASGTYVQFLDADDLLLPDKIERDLAVLGDDRPALLFGSFEGFADGEKIYERDTFLSDDPWVCLVRQNFGHTSANLFRADAVRAVGGWDEGRPYNQEYDLMVRILQAEPTVAFAHHKRTHVRRVPGSVSYVFSPEMREARVEIDAAALSFLRTDGARPEAVAAFEQALFLQLRQLYPLRPSQAVDLHRRIFGTGYAPTSAGNTALYRLLYRAFGFAAAERVKARLRRP